MKQVSPQALLLDLLVEGLHPSTDGHACSLATCAILINPLLLDLWPTPLWQAGNLPRFGLVCALQSWQFTETPGRKRRLKSEPAPLPKSLRNGGWTMQISRGRRSSATSRAHSSNSTSSRTKSPLLAGIVSRLLMPSGKGCSPPLPSPLQCARLPPSRTKSWVAFVQPAGQFSGYFLTDISDQTTIPE